MTFPCLQAGIPTRLNQWWSSIPFVTSGVVLICGAIYLLCLLIGYDSYAEICFLPSAVASHFQGLYHSHTSMGNLACFFQHFGVTVYSAKRKNILYAPPNGPLSFETLPA
jgi:hypothetical protein